MGYCTEAGYVYIYLFFYGPSCLLHGMENLSSASVKPNATITATRIKPMKLRRAQPSAIKASLKGRSWSGETAGILGRVWVYWMQNPGGHLVLCLHLFLILLWQFSGFTPALWLLNYLGSSKWALVRKQESVDNWIGVFFFPPHAQQAASIPGVFWTFSLLRQFYTWSIIPEQQTNFPEFSNGTSSSKSKLHRKGSMSFFC